MWSMSDFAGRILFIGAAFAAAILGPVGSERARAQNNASTPNAECECYRGLGTPPSFGPKNFCHLVDGRRYDISTHRFFRKAMPGLPEEPLPSTAVPFFGSGMYRIIPEVEILVGPGYGYRSSIAVSTEPFAQRAVAGFDTEYDFVDEDPPTVGEGLRITTHVFTNDCGSQALYFEDRGTRDNFSGNVNRLPVLVEMRSLERDLSFTTFSTSYGFTNEVVQNVIGYYPFTGWCVGDRGLESLDFETGERVAVELTVLDYACNAAPPITQEIAWPIEKKGGGGSGGASGASGTSGTGGSGNPTTTNGGGCSVRSPPTRRMPFVLPIAILMLNLQRRSRNRRQRRDFAK